MCGCVCLCTRVCMYACVPPCVQVLTCTHSAMCAHAHMCIHACMLMFMCAHVCSVCSCMCVLYVHMHTCACVLVCAYMWSVHACACVYAHVCIFPLSFSCLECLPSFPSSPGIISSSATSLLRPLAVCVPALQDSSLPVPSPGTPGFSCLGSVWFPAVMQWGSCLVPYSRPFPPDTSRPCSQQQRPPGQAVPVPIADPFLVFWDVAT